MSQKIDITKCEIIPTRDGGNYIRIHFQNAGDVEIPPGELKVENFSGGFWRGFVSEAVRLGNPSTIPPGGQATVMEKFYYPTKRLWFNKYVPLVGENIPVEDKSIPVNSVWRKGFWGGLKHVVTRTANNLG